MSESATAAALQPSATPLLKRVRRSVPILVVVLVPIALWFAPLPLELKAHHAVAVCSFLILAWITHVIDHGIAGLIGCYLFWALGIVRFDVAFSGFANDSAWFALAAMLFGIMGGKSGLARRLASRIILRIGISHSRILLAVILADYLLTFLIPNGLARVVILAPVVIGLLQALGLGPGSNIGRGLMLIITYTATVFDKTIIAGTAAITARGFIETLGHAQVLWSRWFLAFLPSDIVIVLAAWRITLLLFPQRNASLAGGVSFLNQEIRGMGRWTALEKKSLALILLAAALWMTDFLHHLPASMICIGVVLVAMLPAIGVLDLNDLRQKRYVLLFCFVAAAFGMGEVLKATKTLDVLADALFSASQPLLVRPYVSTLVLYWTGFVSHIFLGSEVSMHAVSMPLLMNFARAHALNPLALGMAWTFAGGGKIFVYQSAVLVGGYSYGYFEPKDLFRLGLALSIVDSIQLVLLVAFYWPLIGLSVT